MDDSTTLNSSGLRYRGSGLTEKDTSHVMLEKKRSPMRHLKKLGQHLNQLQKSTTKSALRPSERKAVLAQEHASGKKTDDDGIETIAVEAHDERDEDEYISGRQMMEDDGRSDPPEDSDYDTSDDDDDDSAEYLLSMGSDDLLGVDGPDGDIKYIYKKAKQRRWYKSKTVYMWSIITILQLCLIAAGVAHIVFNGLKTSLQVWRICFFLAFLPYCWVLGVFFTWFLIKLVEKTLLTYPNALYFTYAIRKQVKYLLTALMVLISWACIMLIDAGDQSSAVNTVYDYILRALGCFSLFLFANLLKRLIAKLMSSTFTGANQKTRMENALKQEKILSALMGPRPMSQQELLEQKMAILKDESSPSSSGDGKGVQSFSIEDNHKGSRFLPHRRHRSQTDEKRVDEHGAHVKIQIDTVSAKIEQPHTETPAVGENITQPAEAPQSGGNAIGNAFAKIGEMAKRTFSDDGSENDEAEAARRKKVDPLYRAQQLERLNRLEKYMRKRNLKVTFRDQLNQVSGESNVDLQTYKKLATFLFWHLTHDIDAREITRKHIAEFLSDKNEIEDAFQMLDHNQDGTITLKDCIGSIEKIYHERCNLASSLRDTKAITVVLEFLIGLVLHTIFLFFYLLIFKAHVSEIWVGFTGLLVAFSFIFASTVSNVFENIVFLFGVHPYDIGDTLLINNQYLTIDEITINFTCCISGYNLRVWFPNQQLQSNLFVNLTNSGTKWETIYVYVDIDTDPKILEKIEEACAKVREEKKGEYGPGFRVKFAAAAMPYKVGIEMVYEYSHQGINFQRTACARSWMYETFCRILSENNIQFTWPDTRVNTTDFNMNNLGQQGDQGQQHQQQIDSSRGGRSNLQTNIFEQPSN